MFEDSIQDGALVRCFICDEIVESTKMSIGMDTRLDIPAKLSQLVGDEYTVIVSDEDYLCNLCNQLMEKMDELQKYLDCIVVTLSNHLNRKYNLITDESNTQEGEDKNMKRIDTEVFSCTICPFSSAQKHTFESHTRIHVLNNINSNNNVVTEKLHLFECKDCFKTYSKREDLIKHMQLDHTLSPTLDETDTEGEPNSESEKESRLYSCNNCFLTFVDESLLIEHDCPQESDHDGNESDLNTHESRTDQIQTKFGEVEQYFLDKDTVQNENSSYGEANDQSVNSIKLNNFLEGKGHSEMSTNVNTDLQSFESVDIEKDGPLFGNISCLVCNEMFPSAEKMNEHCKKHKTNLSVENNDEGLTDFGVEELIVFDHNIDIVTAEEKNMICENNKTSSDQNCITTNNGFQTYTKKKVFVCGKCEFKTSLSVELKAHFLVHLKKNNASKPDRICSICDISFERVARYQRHMKSHENSEGPLNCSNCGIQVQDKIHLRNHNMQNHPVLCKKPVCDMCNELFPTFKLLKKHKYVKHNGHFIYKCNLCDKSFKQKIQLKNHLEYAHRSSPKCRFCNKTIENLKKLREHEYRHMRHDSKIFQCDICSKVFKTHSGLRFHKLRHSGKYPFFCEICGHGFVSIKMLEEHRGVHTKEDRYMCDICGRMFCFYSSYMIHRKWHDNPLPYKCNICNQKFHHTSVLAVHKRRVHTGERPYKCPFCVLTFVVSSTYKKHLCLHTQEFPYNCNNCNRGFTTRRKYSTHLAKIHGDYSLLNQGPKKCEYKMSLRQNE